MLFKLSVKQFPRAAQRSFKTAHPVQLTSFLMISWADTGGLPPPVSCFRDFTGDEEGGRRSSCTDGGPKRSKTRQLYFPPQITQLISD